MLVSGGGIGAGGGGTIAGTVPIGTFFTCIVTAPAGLTLTSDTWSGLGNVGSYISGAGNTPPPPNMLGIPVPFLNPTPVNSQDPQTSTASTHFLVVAPNTAYTVSVTVTYQGVTGQWTSAVSFTSGQVPTCTYFNQVRNVPPPTPTISPDAQKLLFVNANQDGMGIEAQTSVNFPGQYMFMQLVKPVLMQYIDSTNTTYQIANTANNPTNLPALDTGGLGANNNTLGMAVQNVSNGAPIANNQWTQDNMNPQDVVEYDTVPLSVPSPQQQPAAPTTATQASVGGLNGIGGSENFTTYLMYEPPATISGNWVAIGQVTWGWGGTANVNNLGNFQGAVLQPSTVPVQVTAPLTGSAATPLWNATTFNIITAGWQKKV